jgi:hypothetical protein
MKSSFVRPLIAAARMRHGDALLQDARHASLATCAYEDGRPLTPQLIVLCIVTLLAWRRQTGCKVDGYIATGKSTAQ